MCLQCGFGAPSPCLTTLSSVLFLFPILHDLHAQEKPSDPLHPVCAPWLSTSVPPESHFSTAFNALCFKHSNIQGLPVHKGTSRCHLGQKSSLITYHHTFLPGPLSVLRYHAETTSTCSPCNPCALPASLAVSSSTTLHIFLPHFLAVWPLLDVDSLEPFCPGKELMLPFTGCWAP